MEQSNARLLLNCPKCNSGKLHFVKPERDESYVECMDCGFHKDSQWPTLVEAAADWNER